jgi:hypothetical protein
VDIRTSAIAATTDTLREQAISRGGEQGQMTIFTRTFSGLSLAFDAVHRRVPLLAP